MEPLLSLAPCDLRSLAAAIRTGRLSEPYSRSSVERFVSAGVASGVSNSLQELAHSSMSSEGIARSLELLADGVSRRHPVEDVIDLVTTGPEAGGVTNRDTSVVVSELFRKANESVLIAGYAVYQGQKVFRALAERMSEVPRLRVRMYLDIQRKPGETAAEGELVKRFSDHFCSTQWPEHQLFPEVYYDPRSLAIERQHAATLHAKCVVIDDSEVFVSSANFTEAAQERNIEVGLLLHSSVIAERVTRFFTCMEASGHLKRAM